MEPPADGRDTSMGCEAEEENRRVGIRETRVLLGYEGFSSAVRKGNKRSAKGKTVWLILP